MGVDTKGRLLGNVEPEEILNFIRQKYDAYALSMVDKKGSYKDIEWEHVKYDDEPHYVKSGFISFTMKDGESRSLFYYYSNVNHFEDLDFYRQYDLEHMVKSQTTYLSLGKYGHSIEIMRDLVSHFGGWIDEDDCDDEYYYYICKNSDSEITPPIYVTMEEVCEKFGGLVVIKK